MNTNFDKQRFVKCLKYRLTDRFMITYFIMALVVSLPMTMVAFTTGTISLPMLVSCTTFSMFSGAVLANNKFFDTLLPATAFEKFLSFCAALLIYMAAILAIVGSGAYVLAGLWHRSTTVLNIPIWITVMAVFNVMPLGIVIGNWRRINAQNASIAMLVPLLPGFVLVFMIPGTNPLILAALGIVLWCLAYRGYCRRQVS